MAGAEGLLYLKRVSWLHYRGAWHCAYKNAAGVAAGVGEVWEYPSMCVPCIVLRQSQHFIASRTPNDLKCQFNINGYSEEIMESMIICVCGSHGYSSALNVHQLRLKISDPNVHQARLRNSWDSNVRQVRLESSYLISWHTIKLKRTSGTFREFFNFKRISSTFGELLSYLLAYYQIQNPNVHEVRLGNSYLIS